MKNEILRMEHITKYVHGERVLDDVRFNLFSSEILGLVGLNHSGKTLLTKIISGSLPADKGMIFVHGIEQGLDLRDAAQDIRIFYIGQESMLIPGMSVKENIFAIRKEKKLGVIIDRKRMFLKTKELLKKMELDIEPNAKIDSLSSENKHLIQICKALTSNSEVIILDGLTEIYSQSAIDRLKKLILDLRDHGISVIYVNNRLDDIFECADRVIVLKEGKTVRTLSKDEYSKNRILNLLAGYELKKIEKPDIKLGAEVLRAEVLSCGKVYSDVSFHVKSGEILGLAIYEENVRNALGRTLFGMCKNVKGRTYIDGEEVKITNPKSAIRLGIGFVPERICRNGIFANLTVIENIAFMVPRKINNIFGVIKPCIDKYVAEIYLNKAGLNGHLYDNVNNMKELNKMKIIIQKWMVLKPKALIFINPTLGIDMLARDEIYSMIYNIAKQGTAVILITSDLRELIEMSDRMILFEKRNMKGEISRSEAFQIDVLKDKILNMFISR